LLKKSRGEVKIKVYNNCSYQV